MASYNNLIKRFNKLDLVETTDVNTRKYTWNILDVDPKYFKHIIGKQGERIRKLQKEYDLDIRIDNYSRTLKIKGSIENQRKFEEWLESLRTSSCMYKKEIWDDVDPKYFKYIIGKKGGNIEKLQKDFKLNITINNETQILEVCGSDGAKQGFRDWLETIKEPSASWQPVEFIEKQDIGSILGKKCELSMKLESKYNVKMRAFNNKLWIDGSDENKKDILEWLYQYKFGKGLADKTLHLDKKIFFIGLKDDDIVTLTTLESNSLCCNITNISVVVNVEPIVFQNMPNLKQACVDALTRARTKINLVNRSTFCRIMVYTGRIYFNREANKYTISALLDNPKICFNCLSKESIYFNKFYELNLSVVSKHIRYDILLYKLDEKFYIRYKIFLKVSANGDIIVDDVDEIYQENQHYYDIHVGPGYFFNLKERTTKIDIIDPTTSLSTRINVLLYPNEHEYKEMLKQCVDELREVFFENIKISEKTSQWELELPDIPDGYFLYNFRRSERDDYQAESNSHILRMTNDSLQVEDIVSGEGTDLVDMFFVNKGLTELLKNLEWNVEEALECIEKTLLYSSRIMKYILK